MKWLAFGIIYSLLITDLIRVTANTGLVHRRFEYKYSFKVSDMQKCNFTVYLSPFYILQPPYLAQKDNTIPFFEYGGSKLICLIHHFCQHRLFFHIAITMTRQTFFSVFILQPHK